MAKWVDASCRIIIFELIQCRRVRLDCDHLVFVRIDRLRDTAERYSDVCPLAESVSHIQHVARRTCSGKKVLSRSGIADGETLPATH
jgi:hypothetical protein